MIASLVHFGFGLLAIALLLMIAALHFAPTLETPHWTDRMLKIGAILFGVSIVMGVVAAVAQVLDFVA